MTQDVTGQAGARPNLREQLDRGEVVFGAWLALAGPAVLAPLSGAGLDYVVFDLQHGAASEGDIAAMAATAVSLGLAPLVRLRYAHPSDVGRALDLGAHGVIIPQVDSVAIARAMVDAARLPPLGTRSTGRLLGGIDDPLVLPIAESRAAVEAIEAIAALDGIDGIYIGPSDLSLSFGTASSPNDPAQWANLERIWVAAAAAGKPVGTHSVDGETARLYRHSGCRLVTVVSDAAAIADAARRNLETAKRDTDGG